MGEESLSPPELFALAPPPQPPGLLGAGVTLGLGVGSGMSGTASVMPGQAVPTSMQVSVPPALVAPLTSIAAPPGNGRLGASALLQCDVTMVEPNSGPNAHKVTYCSDKHARTTLRSMAGLRRDQELCDVIVMVGEREFLAHKLVLSACSPYFKAMFTNDLAGTFCQWVPHAHRLRPVL